MNKRITFRLDKELEDLLGKLPHRLFYNLSVLVREALRTKVAEMINIDNSSHITPLEKGNNNEANIWEDKNT